MKQLSSLTNDELADGICLRAGRIAAAQAELLTWIAEFDRREAWGGPGMLSCAHWLSWRIGLSSGTAREQVRVARRLEELPELAAAFGDGRVSYSKARAITRVAQPDDGVDWVMLARHSSAGQLETIVRGVRRAQSLEEAKADPELAEWKVRTRKRYDSDGNLVITITTRAEYAPIVEAGLEAKRAELQRELDARAALGEPPASGGQLPLEDVPAGTPEPPEHTDVPAGTPAQPKATEGDALLALAEEALAAEKATHPDTARRRRPRLAPQIDPLSGWGRQADGEFLPPSSLRAVMKTLPGRGGLVRLRPVTHADLRRLDLGRSQRTVSDPLRELLGVLDGERCRFPGCTRRKKLHAHHVTFWSEGGTSDLANLVLVCARHHTLIHTQGFQLALHPDRRLTVTSADGVALLHHPDQPWGDPAALAAGCGRRVSAETLPPDHCGARIDLDYVVGVLVTQAA